jgi:hypothetical protein
VLRALSASLCAMNCLLHQALLALEVALGLVQVDLGPGHAGRVTAGDVGLRRQHRGPRRLHVGLGRAHPVLEGLRVDLRDQLALP